MKKGHIQSVSLGMKKDEGEEFTAKFQVRGSKEGQSKDGKFMRCQKQNPPFLGWLGSWAELKEEEMVSGLQFKREG